MEVGYLVVTVMERVVYPFRGKDFISRKVHNSLRKAQEINQCSISYVVSFC